MSTDRAIDLARLDIAATARAMLEGHLSFIEGGRRIAELRLYADLSELDQDAMAFVLIDSETDTLPFGATKLLWSPYALAQLQPEIERSERWAREVGEGPCRRLVERFGLNDAIEVPSEQDFWIHLSLLMNGQLRASRDDNRRFLWIDGFVPDTLLPQLDQGKVLVWAYVSEDSGKSFAQYRVCLHLNAAAVDFYRKGEWSSLLPHADASQWFALDRAAREIDVLLC